MKIKISCKICGDTHTLTQKHFPLVFIEKQEVFEGKGRKRVSLGIKEVVTGYACAKCDRKNIRGNFVRAHNVKQRAGETMAAALKRTEQEIKIKSHTVQVKKTQTGWMDRAKQFFHKRGRG